MPELNEDFVKRSLINYKNESDNFINTSTSYTKQYCSIYLVRLEQMRDILDAKVRMKWGENYPFVKLNKLPEMGAGKYVVIGTLFKDQKLKPSILKDLSESNQLLPQPLATIFTDDSDVLYIEDEAQRYRVIGEITAENLTTGITCALLIEDEGNGCLRVYDYTFADFCHQLPRPVFDKNEYVLFMSGLDLVHLEKTNIQLQMLLSWLYGLNDLYEGIHTKDICRVIIAGNSIRTARQSKKATISMTCRVPESADTVQSVKILDNFVHQLSQVIETDVMPGEFDPTNYVLPQQPLHHCMFPKSSSLQSSNQVTNPYKCSINDMKILGSSGQLVRDVLRFSKIEDPLEAMEGLLKWGHLAPSAPDTLGCFPFHERDPFILDECPHVFFAGNQEKFESRIVRGSNNQEVCLLTIPQFSTASEVCLLNLKNLECFSVSFLL